MLLIRQASIYRVNPARAGMIRQARISGQGEGVNPARAGMIHRRAERARAEDGKPRASGDDPDTPLGPMVILT